MKLWDWFIGLFAQPEIEADSVPSLGTYPVPSDMFVPDEWDRVDIQLDSTSWPDSSQP